MQFRPIATVRTPYKQKFAIPRQSNLAREAIGEIHFHPESADPNALRGIEQFSHLWLIFVFHETASAGWSPLVQPPRLGGRDKVGVFASRATHRPNPIGMSAVRFIDWSQQGDRLVLRVKGVDLLDNTPLLDIKPYIPYADSLPEAQGGYAQSPPPQNRQIQFEEGLSDTLQTLEATRPGLKALIMDVLAQDPRPAYRRRAEHDEHLYGMLLYDLNIRWRITPQGFQVTAIETADNADPRIDHP